MNSKLRPLKASAENNIPSFLKGRWAIAIAVIGIIVVTGYSAGSFMPNFLGKPMEANLSIAGISKATGIENLSNTPTIPTEGPITSDTPSVNKNDSDARLTEILDRLQEQKQDIEKISDRIQGIEDKLNALKPMVSAAVINKKTIEKFESQKSNFDISKLGVVSIAEKSMTVLFNGKNKVIKPGQLIAGDVVFLSYDIQTKQLKTSSGNYFVEQ